MNRRFWKTGIIAVFALLFTAVFHIPVADAHRVTVFAWVDGQTVHTVSKFPGGRTVAGSPIIVYDEGGARLLEGMTDDRGEFSFKPPKRTGLRIVLRAGAGHQGEWNLSEHEVSAAFGVAPSPGTGDSPPPSADAAAAPAAEYTPETEGASIDPRILETTIDRALDRKLAPVKRLLAELHDPGPSISDIVGGIGYIVGLFGVAAYMASRKKSTDAR